MNTAQLAEAFITGKQGSAHNAKIATLITGADEYLLHGYPIAKVVEDGIKFNWHGWYTQTIARHMNAILKAAKSDVRVSASAAKAAGQRDFHIKL